MEEQKSILKAIFDIYRISQSRITPKVAKYGIGRGQWYFLNRLLEGGDGIPQEQLSEELFVDSAHTTRAIKKLEDHGFVFRETDKDDARKKNVFLTKKFMGIKDEYHQIYKEFTEILIDDFTLEEYELLLRLIYKMRNNIESYK